MNIDEFKEILRERLRMSSDPSEQRFLEAALSPEKYDIDKNGVISRDELYEAIYEIFSSNHGNFQINDSVKDKMKISIRNYVKSVKSEMSFVETSDFILNLQPHVIFKLEDIIGMQKTNPGNNDL